jgi:hypothetical protein
MQLGETIAVYFENRTKPMNMLCGQNAGLFNEKDGTCSYDWVYMG